MIGTLVGGSPRDRVTVHTRLLAGGDAARAAHLAREAFGGDAFYERAMGFDARAFADFWDEFFRLAVRDAGCRVFGLDVSGELQGVLVATQRGFPGMAQAVGYLRRLLTRLGPRRLIRYLRFVRAYERAMRRPASEEEREARCYWLFVSRSAPARGLGSHLLRTVGAMLHRAGFGIATGLVDAGNARLLRFYRREGMMIGPPFPFFGGYAARIEIQTARLTEPVP